MNLAKEKTICLALSFSLLTGFSFKGLQAQILPYKYASLKVEVLVKDLLKRMTIEEKANQMLKLNLADLNQDKNGIM